MADNMLTETAFVIPGTKTKVPRWAVLAIVAGLIIILLIAKKAGTATTGTTEEQEATSDEEEAGGSGWEEFLERLQEELNNWQGPLEPPAPVDDPGYTPPESPYTGSPQVDELVKDYSQVAGGILGPSSITTVATFPSMPTEITTTMTPAVSGWPSVGPPPPYVAPSDVKPAYVKPVSTASVNK